MTQGKKYSPFSPIEISTLDNIRLPTWILSSLSYHRPPPPQPSSCVSSRISSHCFSPSCCRYYARSTWRKRGFVVFPSRSRSELSDRDDALRFSRARRRTFRAQPLRPLRAAASVIVDDRSGADGRARCIYWTDFVLRRGARPPIAYPRLSRSRSPLVIPLSVCSSRAVFSRPIPSLWLSSRELSLIRSFSYPSTSPFVPVYLEHFHESSSSRTASTTRPTAI